MRTLETGILAFPAWLGEKTADLTDRELILSNFRGRAQQGWCGEDGVAGEPGSLQVKEAQRVTSRRQSHAEAAPGASGPRGGPGGG